MNSSLLFPISLRLSDSRESNAHHADDELLVRCRNGEIAAFDLFLNRYRERVLNLAFQMLRDRDAAEDIAQNVFVRAFSQIHHFRGDAQIFTWLYQITLNECRAKTRRAKNHLSFDDPANNLNGDDCEDRTGSTPEDESLEKIAVERALDQLSQPLRIALVLREMHGLSYEEIARVLKLPVGTVRSRLHEARRQFQAIWERE